MSTNVVLINDKTANNQLPPFIVVRTNESQTLADLEAFLTRKYGETVEIFLEIRDDAYAPNDITVAQLKNLSGLAKYPTLNFAPVIVRRQSPGPLIRPNSPNSSSGSNAYRPNSPSQSRPDTRPNSQISSPRSNSPRLNSPRSTSPRLNSPRLNSPRQSAASSSSIQEIEPDDEIAKYLSRRFPDFFVLREREQTYRDMFTSGKETDKFMGLTEFDPKTVTLGSIGDDKLTRHVFRLKHRFEITHPDDVMDKVPAKYLKLKPASDFDNNDKEIPEEKEVTYREYFQTILESKMKKMADIGKLVPLHQTDERKLIKDIQPEASELMSHLDNDIRPYVMIAGGSIVNNIVSRKYKTPLSDVDIFLVGTRSDEHAEEVTQKMLLYIMRKAQIVTNKYGVAVPQFSVSRSQFAINIKIATKNRENSNRKIRYEYQIILRRYSNPSQVLHGFDLDASGVGYYDGKYYATDRALFSLSTMTLYIDLKRLSESYNYRLAKYAAQKLFTIASPIDFPLDVLQAAFNVKIVPRRRMVLDREKLYNSDMNSTLEGLVIFFRYLNRSSGLHKKNLNISDYNANKVDSGLNDKHGVTIYRDAEDQIVSYAISSKRLDYLMSKRLDYLTSSIKDEAINLIINGDNALLGNSKVTQRVSFISQDPGRQFTGSFNPLKYNLSHWNGIINPTPKLFKPKNRRKSSRSVGLSSKPSSSFRYSPSAGLKEAAPFGNSSLARRTAAINREKPSSSFGNDPYSTVKRPLLPSPPRGRRMYDGPRSSASSLSPSRDSQPLEQSDSGQRSSRSSSIGRTPFRSSSGELSPVTKSPSRNQSSYQNQLSQIFK